MSAFDKDECLTFTVYDIHSLIDLSDTLPELLETCKKKGLTSLKIWYINNILANKMNLKGISHTDIDFKTISNELKEHVPRYVFLLSYTDSDYLRSTNHTKKYKDVLLEMRNIIDAMVQGENRKRDSDKTSRLYFFNPSKRLRTVEIQAYDETEYTMIGFGLKAVGYPINIKKS